MSGRDEEVDKVWGEFWGPLLIKRGVLDVEAVKRELFDYHHLIQELPCLFMAATGDMVSKPNTDIDVVISLIEEKHQREYDNGYEDGQEDLRDELEHARSTPETPKGGGQ